MKTLPDLISGLRGGLIVSCQAARENPLYGPRYMAAFARSAEIGGAVGLRVNGPADIRAAHRASRLPIIGIYKLRRQRWPVYITPTLDAARAVVAAGAQIVAIDATHRPRPGGISPEELIAAIQRELGVPVMADVDSVEEGVAAAVGGADIVATTMAGYTSGAPSDGPDLAVLRGLCQRVDVPVICEGRVRTPEDLASAFDAGAFAVVVGTAITEPIAITRTFVKLTPRAREAA